MKRIGVWIRVSTAAQVEEESPQRHEFRAKAYAQAKGWEIVAVYRLDAVSGKSVMDQAETKQMLADVASGKIEGLIFSKLARLARNTKELLEFADYFKNHGAGLISLEESIDTSSPAGRLFYTLIAAMAQWEREEIAARTSSGLMAKLKMGGRVGGVAPFGYEWQEDDLCILESEAIVIRHIFDLFITHKRQSVVSRLLNEGGYRTRKGTEFSHVTITRMLKNSVYMGVRVANYKGSKEGKTVDKPQDEWIYQSVPAIVSEDVWKQTEAIFEGRKMKETRGAPAVHLFSGIAICKCGTKMYARKQPKKYWCRSCNMKIPFDIIEDIYQNELTNYILSRELLNDWTSQGNERLAEKEALLSTKQEEAKECNAKLERLIELRHREELPIEGFNKHYKPVFERLKQIDEEVPRLEGEIAAIKTEQHSGDVLASQAQTLADQWPLLDRNEKRAIIEIITESIIIDKEEVTINLTHLPTLFLSDAQKCTNGGVLYLDEMPEFRRAALEVLRQPLEEGRIAIARARYAVEYPANFMLIAAMNPCPCGYATHPEKACSCHPSQVQRYRNRISGPLMDRFDLQLEVSPVPVLDLLPDQKRKKTNPPSASRESAEILKRVTQARAIQSKRFEAHNGVNVNARMSSSLLRKYTHLDQASSQLLRRAIERLRLSARAHDRIRKVSRTIADLAGSEAILAEHVAEAIGYRSLDRETDHH